MDSLANGINDLFHRLIWVVERCLRDLEERTVLARDTLVVGDQLAFDAHLRPVSDTMHHVDEKQRDSPRRVAVGMNRWPGGVMLASAAVCGSRPAVFWCLVAR